MKVTELFMEQDLRWKLDDSVTWYILALKTEVLDFPSLF